MTEHEYTLFDRLEVIKKTIEKYGEDNFYIAYSGGKDSTAVHYLIDMALPNNKIPRVFSNTGIEFQAVVDYVRNLQKNDERFVFIQPNKNIKTTLQEVGYPFKSKEHSQKVYEYQRKHEIRPYMQKYIDKEKFGCPSVLKYQFTKQNKLKISHLCCKELKKKPSYQYEKDTGRFIGITGMMAGEGGVRKKLGCILTKGNKVHRFNPLIKVSRDWEEWFIKKYSIKLCELYYAPYNFERTGCKGCPFNLKLEEDLEIMERYLPNERKQCEIIWKPVYDEYRRIGYRLKKEEQIRLI